jgi:hypothetical protein
MHMHCNAGQVVMNMISHLPGYPREVWYNPDGIANILSLANMKNITEFITTGAGRTSVHC